MNENHKDKKVQDLENQLERSGIFTHTGLSVQAERINEIESFLFGLIDTLTASNTIELSTLEENIKKVRTEILEKKEHIHAGLALRLDDEEIDKEPINCQERLHVCKAACCRLSFALSAKEIENGTMKWDLGQPYINRQQENGYCFHLKCDSLTCGNYKNRSVVCKNYNCRNDKRIWTDFDEIQLNEQWLSENLQSRKLQLETLYMIPEQ